MADARPTGKDWHRNAVAGRNWREENVWGRVGKLQCDFLISQGLQPHHRMLDVACGALRAGVHLIKYLEDGHYYGIDKEQDLLDAGRSVEMPRFGVEGKSVHLIQTADFDLGPEHADVEFDFAIAHSLFTHLVPELIERCLERVVPRLTPEGKFFATFHRSRDGKIDKSKPLAGFQAWRKDERLLTQYPLSMFEEMAERLGISVVFVGDWDHPYNKMGRQLMLAFQRVQCPEVLEEEAAPQEVSGDDIPVEQDAASEPEQVTMEDLIGDDDGEKTIVPGDEVPQ